MKLETDVSLIQLLDYYGIKDPKVTQMDGHTILTGVDHESKIKIGKALRMIRQVSKEYYMGILSIHVTQPRPGPMEEDTIALVSLRDGQLYLEAKVEPTKYEIEFVFHPILLNHVEKALEDIKNEFGDPLVPIPEEVRAYPSDEQLSNYSAKQEWKQLLGLYKISASDSDFGSDKLKYERMAVLCLEKAYTSRMEKLYLDLSNVYPQYGYQLYKGPSTRGSDEKIGWYEKPIRDLEFAEDESLNIANLTMGEESVSDMTIYLTPVFSRCVQHLMGKKLDGSNQALSRVALLLQERYDIRVQSRLVGGIQDAMMWGSDFYIRHKIHTFLHDLQSIPDLDDLDYELVVTDSSTTDRNGYYIRSKKDQYFNTICAIDCEKYRDFVFNIYNLSKLENLVERLDFPRRDLPDTDVARALFATLGDRYNMARIVQDGSDLKVVYQVTNNFSGQSIVGESLCGTIRDEYHQVWDMSGKQIYPRGVVPKS